MTHARQDALDRAVEAICRPSIDDYLKGRIDRDELEKTLRRRQGDIARLASEMLAGKPAPNCQCGEPATTVIAGRHYCETHAAAAPRLDPPRLP